MEGPEPRFELSDAERATLQTVGVDWRLSALLRMLLRSPRLVPHVARLAVRAAVQGIWNDVELGVLLDSERVRQRFAGTARGAAWSPDHTFLDALRPVLRSEDRALEIGCGVGRISRQVAGEVRELVCTDVSQIMLSEAAENLASHGNVQYIQTRGYWLQPIPDASVDLVYSHAVFFFFDLYPALAMLDATSRVLRDGGSFVIDFLTMDRPDWAGDSVELARHYASRGTFGARAVRPYTEAQIRSMCRAVGLDVADAGYGATTAADLHPPLIVTGTASAARRSAMAAADAAAGPASPGAPR